MLPVVAILLPLVLASGLAVRGPVRRACLAGAPLAAVPALLAALWLQPGDAVAIEYLLLGAELRLDAVGEVFLGLTAGLWLLAGVFSVAYLRDDPRRTPLVAFGLLAMAGNFTVCLAGEVATFYVGFALMTFAGYGLVIHERTERARRAGRVYIALAVLGEACLLAGLLLAFHAAGTRNLGALPAGVAAGPATDVVVALLLAGFGVKAGLLGLHVWLPLAHPVAPTPASAVLSGAMVKAGLLGWLRFLPLGEVAFPGWGWGLVALGFVAAFGGAVIGLLQDEVKTALAYSTVSQMGLMTATVGMALIVPASWPLAASAISLYALHHGLTKGALFLGAGVIGRGSRLSRAAAVAVLTVLALNLAAAPLTGGAAAKPALKDVGRVVPGGGEVLVDLLTLSGAATALLLGRVLLLAASGPVAARTRAEAGRWLPWLACSGLAVMAGWLGPGPLAMPGLSATAPDLAGAWTALWPVLIGVGLLLGVTAASRQRGLPLLPAGDLLVPASAAVGVLRRRAVHGADALDALLRAAGDRLSARLTGGGGANLRALDAALSRWEVVGLVFVVLSLAYVGLMA